MSDVPVTVLEVKAVTLTASILEQIPILKLKRAGAFESLPAKKRVVIDTYEGVMEVEPVGYVWRPDVVGHRACYWVLVKVPEGLRRVHVYSAHSKPAEPPIELSGMKQIFVVEPDGERCSSTR
jgi:hypothetical protein